MAHKMILCPETEPRRFTTPRHLMKNIHKFIINNTVVVGIFSLMNNESIKYVASERMLLL